MASGTLYSTTGRNTSRPYYRRLKLDWSSTNDVANNASEITWTISIVPGTISDTSSTTVTPDGSWVRIYNMKLVIDGEEVYTQSKSVNETNSIQSYGGVHPDVYSKDGRAVGTITGKKKVYHGATGSKSVSISLTGGMYDVSVINLKLNTTINMTVNPVYDLMVGSRDSFTTLSAIRTYRGDTKKTVNESVREGQNVLYSGDKISLLFTPAPNYETTMRKVNGVDVENNYETTVGTDINVSYASRALASSVSLQSSLYKLGESLAVNVERYNENSTHKVEFFVTGYESDAGTVYESSVGARGDGTSYQYIIPENLIRYFVNTDRIDCYLKCTTYEAGTDDVMGSPSIFAFKILISDDYRTTIQMPEFTTGDGSYNATGNRKTVINIHRDLTAKFKIKVFPSGVYRPTIDISNVKLNGVTPTSLTFKADSSGEYYEAVYDESRISDSIYNGERIVLTAEDSRRYTHTISYSGGLFGPTFGFEQVDYIPLTFNPTISRVIKDNKILISFNGTCQERIGVKDNALSISYSYKQTGVGGTVTGDDATFIMSANNSNYYESTPNLYAGNKQDSSGDDQKVFSYENSYTFIFTIKDNITTITREVFIPPNIPAFDWGKSDISLNLKTTAQKDFIVKGRLSAGGIESVSDTGWIDVPLDGAKLSNGSAITISKSSGGMYEGLAYRIVNGNHITVGGCISFVTPAANNTIIINQDSPIPEEARPDGEIVCDCLCDDSKVARMSVTTDGEIVINWARTTGSTTNLLGTQILSCRVYMDYYISGTAIIENGSISGGGSGTGSSGGVKVDMYQGTDNAGKFCVVGPDGNITFITLSAWQGGAY